MIRAIIADDESLVRENIRMRLSNYQDIIVIEECSTGSETIQKVKKYQPDLLFLDIRMPGRNGFEVLENVKEQDELQVIFITAYDKYALKAFEANAVDYLLKPIDSERFDKAIQRTKKNLNQVDLSELKTLLADIKRQKQTASNIPDRLKVKHKGKTRFIPVADISFLMADGDYVKVNLRNSRKFFLKRDTMKYMAEKLKPVFLRIHRSTIVNTDDILEIETADDGSLAVVLKNGKRLNVSDSYRSELDHFFKSSC